MVFVLRAPADPRQIESMLVAHGIAIKVAVDVEQGLLAGGGEFHADCRNVLVDQSSMPEDVWGATWYVNGKICYDSLVNLKPRCGNTTTQVSCEPIRRKMGVLIRRFLENKP